MTSQDYINMWRSWWGQCQHDLNAGEYPSYPRVIQFQPKAACNGKCTFCPGQSFQNGQAMPDSSLSRLITETTAAAETQLFIPSFQCEPLMDPRIYYIIQRLKRRAPDKMVQLITNGYLLNRERIEALMTANLDILEISLHAYTASTYRKLNPAFNFETVTDNVRLALAVKDELQAATSVFVRFIVNSINEAELDDFATYWRQQSAEVLSLPILNRCGSVEEYDRLIPTTKTVAGPMGPANGTHSVCFWPFLSANILADGRVLTCCNDWKAEETVGNISERSLREIFETGLRNSQETMLETGNLASGICQQCSRTSI